MWFWITDVRVLLLLMLLTQEGSCECHTSVCPLTSFWLVWAKLTTGPMLAIMPRSYITHHNTYQDSLVCHSWSCFAILHRVSFCFFLSISFVDIQTFDGIPFHAILWRYCSKVGLNDSSILSGCEKALIRCNSEVFLALGSELYIDTVLPTSAVTSPPAARRRCWCGTWSGCCGCWAGCRCGIGWSSRSIQLSALTLQ